jgi:spore germination cell wall hydrolase CwlJ-like protein
MKTLFLIILSVVISLITLLHNFHKMNYIHKEPKIVSCTETCTANDIKNIRLLAEVIYFEARSEPSEGQIAVAFVVMNRTHKDGFPGTIEKVVKEQNDARCQFSYRCDGIKDQVKEQQAWTKAVQVATLVYNNKISDPTAGAEYYLNPEKTKVRFNNLRYQIKIGSHIFYKA